MSRHRYHVQLRWSDMDALRHVNNVQFLRFLEDARVQMLVVLGRRGVVTELGQVVARHEIDYLAPLHFRTAPVVVDTWITRVGRTSYTVAYEVREEVDEIIYARASTVMVCVDLESGRSVEIDPIMREQFREFLDDGRMADGDATIAGIATNPVRTK